MADDNPSRIALTPDGKVICPHNITAAEIHQASAALTLGAAGTTESQLYKGPTVQVANLRDWQRTEGSEGESGGQARTPALPDASISDLVSLEMLAAFNPRPSVKTMQNRISDLRNGPLAFPEAAPGSGKTKQYSYAKLLPCLRREWPPESQWPDSIQSIRAAWDARSRD